MGQAYIFAGLWTINIVAGNFAGHAISHAYNSAVNKIRISYTKTKKYHRLNEKKFEKDNKLKSGDYHRKVKPKILKDTLKEFTKDMRRVGDNPDIWVDNNGSIEIASRTNGYRFETHWNIKSFLP